MRVIFTLTIILLSLYSTAQQKKSITFYFNYASEKLTEASQREIEVLVKDFEVRCPLAITIKGYTDKNGSDAYNQALSSRRAQAIYKILQPHLPDSASVKTLFYGENFLLTDINNEQPVNRRVELIVEYTAEEEPVTELQPYIEDVEEQRFSMNLDDTAYIKAKDGTCIKIPPGSIQDNNGIIRKGEAQLIIKEYYKTSDILLSGLHSFSNEGLLQTGGMIQLTIIQNGDTMSKQTQKHVTITMPKFNEQLTGMNVFTINNPTDSAHWKNSGTTFSETPACWNFPTDDLLKEVYRETPEFYSNIRTGYKYTEEWHRVVGWRYHLLSKYKSDRPKSKKTLLTTTKPNDTTITIHAKIQYRQRGFIAFGIRELDTTYSFTYSRAKYHSLVDTLNWINCDRFYSEKNKINFTIKTPGYSNVAVMVYFKDLNAFMPAYPVKNGYEVKGVPAGKEVILVSMGKKQHSFYFGKLQTTTERNAKLSVAIERVNEEEFRKRLKEL
ncbi:MAG: OmpA family protein [Agriterribacter sp.]